MLDSEWLLKKMRGTTFARNRLTILNTFAQVLPANAKRLALIVPGIGNEFLIMVPGVPTATIEGFINPANAPPLILDVWRLGQLVTSSWQARAQTGGFAIDFIEIIDVNT